MFINTWVGNATIEFIIALIKEAEGPINNDFSVAYRDTEVLRGARKHFYGSVRDLIHDDKQARWKKHFITIFNRTASEKVSLLVDVSERREMIDKISKRSISFE